MNTRFLLSIVSVLLIVSAAGLAVQSNTAHLKFTLGCGGGLPVCVSIVGTATFAPFATTSEMVNYTLQVQSVSASTLSTLYLNTTVFNGPMGVTYRFNNLNSTLPTSRSLPTQWLSGPFNLAPGAHFAGLFQLYINGSGLPLLTIGQYDIGFTVIG